MYYEEWYAQYQKTNPEKFSDSFKTVREEESLEGILRSIAMATTSTGHVEVIDVSVEDDETKIPHLHTIEESRHSMARITLRLKAPDEGSTKIVERDVTIEAMLPRLVEKYFFLLDGSRYFSILQLVDAGVYPVRPGVVGLKTMLMPFTMTRHREVFVNSDDQEVEFVSHTIRAFRKEIPITLYYFSILGFDETIKFLAAEDKIDFTSAKEPVEATGAMKFLFGKDIAVWVDTEFAKQEPWVIGNILSAILSSKANTVEELKNVGFWNLQLGKQFTSGNDAALRKAEKVSVSFQRILDSSTRANLAKIPERDKKNIFTLTRWICSEFDILNGIDSTEIQNKRIRLWEYVLYPLIKKLSSETYRIINCRQVTIKTLESAFGGIKKNICTKALITSELLRYSTVVNTLDLFGAALCGTQGGPQGISSDSVPTRLRGINPSYKGNIGFSKASASDPGITFGFTPFFKTDGLFFDKTQYPGTEEFFPDNVETDKSEILQF